MKFTKIVLFFMFSVVSARAQMSVTIHPRGQANASKDITITLPDSFISLSEKQQLDTLHGLDLAIRAADVLKYAMADVYTSVGQFALSSQFPKVRLSAICILSQGSGCDIKYLNTGLDIWTIGDQGTSHHAASAEELAAYTADNMLAVPDGQQPGKQYFSIDMLGQVANLAPDPRVKETAIEALIQTMRFNRYKNPETGAYDYAVFAGDRLAQLNQTLAGTPLADKVRLALSGTATQDTVKSIKDSIAEKLKALPASMAADAAKLSSM